MAAVKKISKTKTKPVKAKKAVAPTKKAIPKKKSVIKKTAPKPKPKKPIPRKPVSAVKVNKVVKKKPVVKKVVPKATPPKPVPIVSKKSETKIGMVIHYYAQIGVAVIQIEQKSLRAGDMIHIKGHASDFTQSIESMEIEHQPVTQVKTGDMFGMKVTQHVRVGDLVYR